MFKMIFLQKKNNTILYLFLSIAPLTINIFDHIQNNNKSTKKNNFLSYDERMKHLLNYL